MKTAKWQQKKWPAEKGSGFGKTTGTTVTLKAPADSKTVESAVLYMSKRIDSANHGARTPYIRVEDWLKSVKYKLGWTFRVVYTATGWLASEQVVAIAITMQVPHRDTGEIIPVVLHRAVPHHILESFDSHGFFRWLRHCIHELETHEADEFLIIDGKRMFDPHAPSMRVTQ
jgi:hypothetical protein